MGLLSIHPGDLHLRSAYLGPLDEPAAVEDSADPARFVTPSIVALDTGGSLLGYPALMASATARPERVLWRFSRAALGEGGIVATDASQRGLTSETFLAFAASRLAWEAQAYAGTTPDLALVVPDELPAATLQRLSSATAAGAQRAVRVVRESAALFATQAHASDGDWMIVSFDDDALRVRLVRRAAGDVTVLSAETLPGSGLAAVRARWLEAWDAAAAALVPGARAFEGDTWEFERVWQELWESLDAEYSDASRALAWPLVRRSSVLTVCAHTASLTGDLRSLVEQATRAAVALLARVPGTSLQGALVVAPGALRRLLVPSLASAVGLAQDRCRTAGAEAYARGGALVARNGNGPDAHMEVAPAMLGVLGVGEDGATALRPVFQAGQPLPATAQFTIMADRDAQKHVVVTLVTEAGEAQDGHRFEFGPLVGSGVQRLRIAVEWKQDGSVDARAVDRDTGAPVMCRDCMQVMGGIALAGLRHLSAP